MNLNRNREGPDPPVSFLRANDVSLIRTAYSIDEVAVSIGVSRDKIYAAIKAGHLRCKKMGKRSLVTAEALNNFLEGLPELNLREEA